MKTWAEPLTHEHLSRMDLTASSSAFVRSLGVWGRCVDDGLLASSAVALMAPEGVVACGGITNLWEGVCDLWLRAGALSARYPVELARASKKATEALFVSGMRRVQVSVDRNDAKARRFARWLGFSEEGVMRSFGPSGEDYILMARIGGAR